MAAPVAVVKLLPLLKRMWLPLLNLVGEKNEYRVIVTAPNYMEFTFLWGVLHFEKGEKREFAVRGTEAYFNSLMSGVGKLGFNVSRSLPR